MLYLSRKIGESIVIDDDIEVTVVEIRGKSIKLGLSFPAEVSVYRREVFDRIQAEKAIAGETGAGGTASGTVSETGADHERNEDDDAPVAHRASARARSR